VVKETVRVCECCGHPMPTYNTLRGLTPSQQKIFALLEKAGQAGMSRKQLMHGMYGDDPDGGPEFQGVLNVQRARMKDVLAENGMRIVTMAHSLWKLEKL
jgi:hypothetical protein